MAGRSDKLPACRTRACLIEIRTRRALIQSASRWNHIEAAGFATTQAEVGACRSVIKMAQVLRLQCHTLFRVLRRVAEQQVEWRRKGA